MSKAESKMRKTLLGGNTATAVLLYHVSKRTKPKDTWRNFHCEYVDKMLKTYQGSRYKLRLNLATRGLMTTRVVAQDKRTRYDVKITDENYAKIVSTFGPIEMDEQGRPILPPEKVGEAKEAGPRTCLNSAALGQPLQNCYEVDQELQRRKDKTSQELREHEKRDKEEKEKQTALNRKKLKALESGEPMEEEK